MVRRLEIENPHIVGRFPPPPPFMRPSASTRFIVPVLSALLIAKRTALVPFPVGAHSRPLFTPLRLHLVDHLLNSRKMVYVRKNLPSLLQAHTLPHENWPPLLPVRLLGGRPHTGIQRRRYTWRPILSQFVEGHRININTCQEAERIHSQIRTRSSHPAWCAQGKRPIGTVSPDESQVQL